MKAAGTHGDATVSTPPTTVGRRIVVTGQTGAGKSTLSKSLSEKTGLSVICPTAAMTTPGQRFRDEWGAIWRIWRGRRSERERELSIVAESGARVDVYVLRSTRAAAEFLDGLGGPTA